LGDWLPLVANPRLLAAGSRSAEDPRRKSAFHPQRVDEHLLDCGTEFPREIAGSCALIETERRRLPTVLGLEVMR
jgi:hypothetical protein